MLGGQTMFDPLHPGGEFLVTNVTVRVEVTFETLVAFRPIKVKDLKLSPRNYNLLYLK